MNDEKEEQGFYDSALMVKIKALLPPNSTIHFIDQYKVDIYTAYHINNYVIDVGFSLNLVAYLAHGDNLLKHTILRSAHQAMEIYINSLFEL